MKKRDREEEKKRRGKTKEIFNYIFFLILNSEYSTVVSTETESWEQLEVEIVGYESHEESVSGFFYLELLIASWNQFKLGSKVIHLLQKRNRASFLNWQHQRKGGRPKIVFPRKFILPLLSNLTTNLV